MLNKLNLYFGVLLILIFLFTGYYMKTYLKPQYLTEELIRMEYRANHIYILFIAVINMVIYKFKVSERNVFSKSVGYTFQLLPMIAGVLLVIAFFKEHTGNLSERLMTFSAILSVFVSAILFFVHELYLMMDNK